MCLLTNNETQLIAEEDIKCYKIVTFSELHGYFTTPFTHTPIPHMVRIGIEKFKPTVNIESKEIIEDGSNYSDDGFKYMINGGYIHVYKNLNEILKYYNRTDLYIFECTIPKGTRYYEGAFAFKISGKKIHMNSYCAKEIIFKQML